MHVKKYEKGFVCKTINGSLILINRLPNKNKRNKYEAYWKCFCGNEWLCERFNNEEVENIKTLAKQGLSNYKIAKQMNCGRKVIIDIIRNRGAYNLNKEINEKNIKF